MKQATILDLSDINKLMSDLEQRDCHEYVRITLLNKVTHWFYKEGSAMIYEPMDNGRYNMHIYNTNRGDKDLVKWCTDTGKWMFENTEAKNLINFVKKDRKDLRMFMIYIGSKKVCGIGDETLYTYSRESYEEIR